MRDSECVLFLQWVLPKLRMRWPGFRKVRKQVCKRVARRMRQLDLPDAPAYRAHLETHPDEWTNLDVFCRITISRFFRDRAVFDLLGRGVLPQLAQQAADEKRRKIRVWSIGCGAGEECYSLTIQWRLLLQPCFPDCELHILGTDSDEQQLERARAACYPGKQPEGNAA
jgi:chemotaxis protein methyltransferase CheR